ncbi:hypothetical protein [Salinibacterium sp. TMP30]|uniref:hypothetical protein n=1 Tax=Salinibacterium sp. TMP30 TaxID=3138237 RepID=UPI003138DD43
MLHDGASQDADYQLSGGIMGFIDNAKDTGEATAKKVGEFVDDTKERVSDAADKAQADAEVSKAEADLERAKAEREATEAKNEYKEDLR